MIENNNKRTTFKIGHRKAFLYNQIVLSTDLKTGVVLASLNSSGIEFQSLGGPDGKSPVALGYQP